MEESNRYDINYFKPHTPFLKDNIRLITISVVVWAVAVFGFHLLLKVLEEPTPEPAYNTYKAVFSKQQAATDAEKQDLAKVYLTLVGKYIQLRDNDAIKQNFSALVAQLLPEGQQAKFKNNPSSISKDDIAKALNLKDGLLKEAIPSTVSKSENADALAAQIPGIMDKYLIHNQSVLTDTKIFGFPLHYFYTAVFLKILFCLICLVYCKLIDGIMKKHGLETAHE